MPFFPQFSNLFVPPYVPTPAGQEYGWYKADVGVTHEFSEDYEYEIVTTWADQSGSGHDLVKIGNPPEYQSTGWDGDSIPAIYFGDINGYNGSYLERTNDQTIIKSIIAVVETSGNIDPYRCIIEAYGGGLYSALSTEDVDEETISLFGSYWANFTSYAQILQNTKYILGVRTSDGESTFGYINDSGAISMSGNGFQPRSKITVGNDSSHGQVLYGKLAELIIFDSEISDTSMETYISNLNSKWAVY